MKNLILLLIFSSLIAKTQTPSLGWVKVFGSKDWDMSVCTAQDVAGNIYTTGYFRDTTDFDPGIGIFTLTPASNGYSDVFVTKTDASGNFLWVRHVGALFKDIKSTAIAISPAGFVVIAGVFEGTVDFDPGNPVYNLSCNGLRNAFILALDLSGSFIFADSFGNSGVTIVNSIVTNSLGDIFAVGIFDNPTDFDPSSFTSTIAPAGLTDGFVLKLTSLGNLMWVKNIGGQQYDNGFAVDQDLFGDLVITGTFNGTVDFDPTAATYTLSSFGYADLFILKLTSSGSFVWAKNIGGSGGSNIPEAVKTAPHGDIYITGYYQDTTDFDPGIGTYTLNSASNINSYDIFLLKLNSQGNFAWARSFGGVYDDKANALAIDGQQNIYLGGYFSGQADFDPGPNNYMLNATGSSAMFICRVDTSGNMVWALGIGGQSGETITSISIIDTSAMLLTGCFDDIVDFDPTPAVHNVMSKGRTDAFLWKIEQTSIDLIESSNSDGLIIYPNPFNGQFFIEPTNKQTPINFSLYDCIGQITREWTSQGKTCINLQGHSKGVFFLVAKTGTGTYRYKLVNN